MEDAPIKSTRIEDGDLVDRTNADVISLLELLDSRLDEPCAVPGCLHHGEAIDVRHDVVGGLRAA